MVDLDQLNFGPDGLVPAIVQAPSGEVRMLAWMSRESLERTLATGLATFWSRSRRALWTKGETSGSRLRVQSVHADCDGDTLLVVAVPEGPTCHRGTPSCFDGAAPAAAGTAWLGRLEEVLRDRRAGASLEGSYTQKLFARGVDRIGKKVVEEAGEVVLAAKSLEVSATPGHREAFLGEAADLLFHLEVLLVAQGHTLADAAEVLRLRHLDR